MEVEIDYEDDHEIECPHCGKKSTHTVKGTAVADIEPPERECGD
jgi:DNA-directed RNA polymerase subunit RPC12/RpoP